MAIAFDATGNGDVSNAASLTFAHTNTGSDLRLYVGFYTLKLDTAFPTLNSVTYGGVAMTAVTGSPTSHQTNLKVYLYFLDAPATGANDVVITWSAQVDQIAGISGSYTGVSQTGTNDSQSTTTNSSASTSITLTTTTVADNCWVVGFERNEAGNATDGADTLHRGTVQTDRSFFDSDGVVSPAGSRSLIQNFNSAKNSGLIASFAPAGAASTISPRRMMRGIGS